MKSIWCLTCCMGLDVKNFSEEELEKADAKHLKHDGAHTPHWVDEETDRTVQR